jgi:hypothetical protein
MSEIPFVNHLGDALEAAITEPVPAPAHRRYRRLVLVLSAGAIVLSLAAAAVAHFLSSPDQLANTSIACYSAPDLGSDVTIITNNAEPVAACADAYRRMGRSVPPLVACATDTSVAVIPGADESTCRRLNLQPLPQGYASSQAKTAHLAQRILALEAEHDCVTPEDLARRVQPLLDQQGWIGWQAKVQAVGTGPCGTVSNLDGGGHRQIGGALDPTRRLVIVSHSAARSTTALLYGANGLAPRLEDESGSRCFTVAGLTTLVEARATAMGRRATVHLEPPLPPTVTIADAREARYAAGCAILTDVRPAADGRNFVASIPRTRQP